MSGKNFVLDSEGNKVYEGDWVRCLFDIFDFSGSGVPMIKEGEKKRVYKINLRKNIEFGDIRSYYDNFDPNDFVKVKKRRRRKR